MRRSKKGRFLQRTTGEFFEGFSVYYDAKGYPVIWVGGKDVKLHIFVWEKEYGAKPPDMDIHHKDLNKSNYKLENLELLSKSDHRKFHAGWVRKNGEWVEKPCSGCSKILPLSMFYPRKGYTPSAKCKKCHCETNKKWVKKNPERRKAIALKHFYKKRRENA